MVFITVSFLFLRPFFQILMRLASPIEIGARSQSSLSGNPINNPEFIIEKGAPTRNRKYNPDSHLIGDVQVTAEAALSDIKKDDPQWRAMFNHARSYQLLHFATYITFKSSWNNSANVNVIRAEMMKSGVKKGVVLVLAVLFE